MNQEQFILRNEAVWQRLERALHEAHGSKTGKKPPAKAAPSGEQTHEQPPVSAEEFPHLYRQVCHHLALARSRLYSQPLIERLGDLVLRGHQQLYHSRVGFLGRVMHFAAAGFPQLVRREWRAVLLAGILAYGPFLAMLIAVQYYPDMVYTVMNGHQVRSLESMYEPSLHERLGRERESEGDVYMWGFYIRNNVSIDFQIFAGGILYGVGTVFFLVYNGLYFGVAAGHLTRLGYNETFWGFVAGHSALELTAMVLAGAAGLKLGGALIAPGRKSRARALRDNADIAVRILYGAATMTFMAAFIEAFWSSIAWMPVTIKYGVGIGMWILLLAYFTLLGRRRAA